MLKYRLIFGTLMAAVFIGLVVFDAWFDGSLFASVAEKTIQGSILCALIALLLIPAQIEMTGLLGRTGVKIFKPVVFTCSILLATSWYWRQFVSDPLNGLRFHLYYVLLVTAFSLLLLFVFQARCFGNSGVMANCAGNFFAIFYLGFLSSFVLGMRIEFGVWVLLMFITVIKCSDIGAYTLGKLFGKHKFAPRISPGKTWEGMVGAVLFASAASLAFSFTCVDIAWPMALLFGVFFAFAGQCGDLAESMLKRDAEQKDSSDKVPGFGGVLDVIDSPLATAPVAYLFFTLAIN
jgi:phosphatidate cytidylyltransferase